MRRVRKAFDYEPGFEGMIINMSAKEASRQSQSLSGSIFKTGSKPEQFSPKCINNGWTQIHTDEIRK
jgi:hypothetical protein